MDEIINIINHSLEQELTNESQINMYYQIGQIIVNKKINTKDLELKLKQEYGIMIAFTKRNLDNMKQFSKFKEIEKLKHITWKNILILMKNNEQYIDICYQYKPTKKELLDYIKNKKPLKKNKTLELDDTLEELKKLQIEVKGEI